MTAPSTNPVTAKATKTRTSTPRVARGTGGLVKFDGTNAAKLNSAAKMVGLRTNQIANFLVNTLTPEQIAGAYINSVSAKLNATESVIDGTVVG